MAAQPNVPSSSTLPAPPPPREIDCLVLDAGPIIKNDPPIDSLLAKAAELVTLPAVIDEIRDPATRSRVETTLLPFVVLRSPRAESIKFVSDFARKTGDLEVLSRADIHLLALTYELECEKNGGDWRLRSQPGQERVNGPPPGRIDPAKTDPSRPELVESGSAQRDEPIETDESASNLDTPDSHSEIRQDDGNALQNPANNAGRQPGVEEPEAQVAGSLKLDAEENSSAAEEPTSSLPSGAQEQDESSRSDDDEGWIVPDWGRSKGKANEAKAKEASVDAGKPQHLRVALLTSDYAMQNVALRINLNVVSPQLARIRQLKTWVLRCHGCFAVTRDMSKQFCPSCGQATLLRTSCSTDGAGNFKIHLKKHFQWNNRGNVYSVPKPVHGAAGGKPANNAKGGGKNGWGTELLLAEDQKEYQRKVVEEKRSRGRDLLDDDALPSFLSGSRDTGGGHRIRLGPGRNVNSRRKR